MTRSLLLTVSLASIVILLLPDVSWSQQQHNLVTFQHRANEKRTRHLHYLQDINYLKIKTADSIYYIERTYAINDTALLAEYQKRYISISLKDILYVKKGKSLAGSMGYFLVILDLELGLGVSAYRLSKGDKEGAVVQMIGTTILAAIFSIPVIVGARASTYHMKKWKIISFTQKYSAK